MVNGNKSKQNHFIRNFALLACVFSVITVMLGYGVDRNKENIEIDTSASVKTSAAVIVIDPGHGGEDGGAVAADGTAEKELNLEFGTALHNICGVLGLNSTMTRETDTLLYDKYGDLENYKGKKKVYDLKNRLRFTEEIGENAVFVGIHMNKFPDPKYSGTHVYYSPNDERSKELADLLQGKVKDALQPENDRVTKRAGSSIFILKRLQTVGILAECGFLSNEEETSRLKTADYKKEFSLTTAVALGEFIESKGM